VVSHTKSWLTPARIVEPDIDHGTTNQGSLSYRATRATLWPVLKTNGREFVVPYEALCRARLTRLGDGDYRVTLAHFLEQRFGDAEDHNFYNLVYLS